MSIEKREKAKFMKEQHDRRNIVTEADKKELTFMSCLLEGLFNRIDEYSEKNQFYFGEVKRGGNMFKKAIDKTLIVSYDSIARDKSLSSSEDTKHKEQVDRASVTTNMIDSFIEQAWEKYQYHAKKQLDEKRD